MTTNAEAPPRAVGEHQKRGRVTRRVIGTSLPRHLGGIRRAVHRDAREGSQADTERTELIYQLIDRLHEDRTAQVTAAEIVKTLSAWLSELGANSPLVEDFANAVLAANWPQVHALGDYLSVDIAEVD